MPDVVIDLGEVTDDAAPRRLPGRRRPPSRRLVVPIVAVLLLVTLTNSVVPVAPTPVTSIPANVSDIAFLGPGGYYVVSAVGDGPDTPVQNKIITVYDLPSAARASRTAVAVTGPILQVVAVDDLVLVSYQADRSGNVVTAAYTAGTERSVWRRYGRLFGLTGSDRVALLAESTLGIAPARWHGVDPRSGQDRWQVNRRTEDASALGRTADQRLDTLFFATPQGRIEAYAVETGRVTAAVDAPAPGGRRRAIARIDLAGDLLLMGDGAGTTAYEAATLDERWRSTLPLAGWFAEPDCGDIICMISYANGLRVLDPSTGRQRWYAERWSSAARFGDRLLVTPPDDFAGVPQPRTVLDVSDGTVRGTLGSWLPVGAAGADGSVPVTREETRTRRVFYGLLNPVSLGVRVAGLAEQVAGECGSAAGVLVCRRVDGSAGVWPFVLP